MRRKRVRKNVEKDFPPLLVGPRFVRFFPTTRGNHNSCYSFLDLTPLQQCTLIEAKITISFYYPAAAVLPFLTYSHYFQRLQGHVFPPEARESLVPDTGQQLLHVGMGYKLFEGEKKKIKNEKKVNITKWLHWLVIRCTVKKFNKIMNKLYRNFSVITQFKEKQALF